MSVKIMTLVWEHSPYSEGSLLVLLALADWADDSGYAWPSISRLAHKSRLERRQVQRILRKLEQDGFLEVEEGRGRGNQNRYLLNLAKLKGDIMTPFEEIKGDIADTEKATFGTQKATLATEKASLVTPDPLVEPLGEPSLDPPYSGAEFLCALAAYDATAKQRKVKDSPEQRRILFKKLERWGETRATMALEDTVTNSWRGVFEPKNGANNGANNDIRRTTAAERNGSQLARNLAVVEKLRRESRGDPGEVSSGNLTAVK